MIPDIPEIQMHQNFTDNVRFFNKGYNLHDPLTLGAQQGVHLINLLDQAGFAWVYHQYCKDPMCRDWLILEKEAKESKIGLWSHPDPIPPWEFRRGKKSII